MSKTGYYVGLTLQIGATLLYFVLLAALISDLSYFYDRQMFAGAEKVLYVAFFKQFIALTVVYAILLFIAIALKSSYKRYIRRKKLAKNK